MKALEIYNKIKNEEININDAVELLESEFNYVKQEGNGFGIYCFDEFDKNITFICTAKGFEGIHKMELDKKFNIPYTCAPDTVDYSVCIYKSIGDIEIYSNVNWNESVIYMDECYPDFIVEEFEDKAI